MNNNSATQNSSQDLTQASIESPTQTLPQDPAEDLVQTQDSIGNPTQTMPQDLNQDSDQAQDLDQVQDSIESPTPTPTESPTQAPAEAPAAKPDPLAALEELLKGSQNLGNSTEPDSNMNLDSGSIAKSITEPNAESATKPTAESTANSEQERQEFTKMEAQQNQADIQEIKEREAALQQLAQSATQADQAPTQENNGAQPTQSIGQSTTQTAPQTSDQKGFEIRQLGHDKIPGGS
ncbi:MAG: hypothetical protein A2383_03380 [Candidatus Pacebacteria bacterium RIFOXYB1_FULL_39_46]|nr:MAG: hypothetical protein A2182_01425 [Candidatus Pacebacteria bacterium RIFOXYA1_FULL_38_18]OGJ38459.1 MAG: hypothetical protein A2383_03380 [Candidatus Pacebacteria bacterium RIFOXYB1_FULL_39_46]OGJ40319.1 MAG: hypothetical protein A2411_03520 [Candidatus Pacebacteria bacterium RIFOXYC1_FULL_39_21]OGJ40892.1 MAG: hypothetical protein A2582_02260 [Candidatus Pacebacteria bacterium RIFOXYD1_FULL_39_27]